jgi:phosphatidylserine/phosphatidylglycerophosphate/cardiolipin synthase-like enzyme
MTAIFWITGIAASIFAAFWLGKILAPRLQIARYTGFGVAAFWLLWTFGFSSIFVGYVLTGPLAIIQAIVIVVAFLINYRIFRERRLHALEIEQLQRELEHSDNERLRAEANSVLKSKIEVIESPAQHRELFLEVLRSAQDSIVILSGWATDYAIEKSFRQLLRNALKRGVSVVIGYGYRRKGEKPVQSDYEKNARKTLGELQQWCAEIDAPGALEVFHFPNHSKILIKDDEFAVCGSFNWLSNAGRSHNDERSYVIYNPDFVSSERDEIIASLEKNVPPTRRQLFKRLVPGWRH